MKKQGFVIFQEEDPRVLEKLMNTWIDEHPNFRIRRTQISQAYEMTLTALVNYEHEPEQCGHTFPNGQRCTKEAWHADEVEK